MHRQLHSMLWTATPWYAQHFLISGCSTRESSRRAHCSLPGRHALPMLTAARQKNKLAMRDGRYAASDRSSSSPSSAAPAQRKLRGNLLQQALMTPPQWKPFLGSLAVSGAALGTLLDGIHSRVGLQVYDLAPVTAGPLVTSLLVPPLLGTFYVVLGVLACITDNLTADSPATQAAVQRASNSPHALAYTAACFGVLAVNLYVSATLFDARVQPNIIFAVLTGLAAVNWQVFDRTSQGLGLAVLCGLGAPAAELVLMSLTGCWHYSRPDVADVFVSWVPLCYAFYVPAVSNLARLLWCNK